VGFLPIINLTKDTVLAEKADIAGTWLTRLKGLLFKDRLPEGNCLVIYPCKAVHTCFMRFNIDILFMNESDEVVYLMEDVPAFRFSPFVKGARYVIECLPGTISSTRTALGDLLTPLEKYK